MLFRAELYKAEDEVFRVEEAQVFRVEEDQVFRGWIHGGFMADSLI